MYSIVRYRTGPEIYLNEVLDPDQIKQIQILHNPNNRTTRGNSCLFCPGTDYDFYYESEDIEELIAIAALEVL